VACREGTAICSSFLSTSNQGGAAEPGAVVTQFPAASADVAPDGTEASDVGRAVTTVPGLSGAGRLGPGGRGPWCWSGADEEVLGVEGAVAAMPRWWGPFDVVQLRISKASRMSTTPEGAGWKTSMVSRVSVMSEGMPDEMVGLDQHEKSKWASRTSAMPKRRGVEGGRRRWYRGCR